MSAELERVFRPRSVAVVGASSDPGKFGGKVMGYLTRHGYAGTILPINPKYDTLDGWPCYASVSAIPADIPVDAVLIAVPRERAVDVVRECGPRGAAAVVFTSGFAEAPGEGAALQRALADEGRRAGVRILGPNSFGYVNFVDRVTASPAIALRHGAIDAGRIGLVSHSGGAALGSIYAMARERGIAFSHIICPGNESDIDACEVIEFLVDDPHTDVVAAVLEGVADGPRLMRGLAEARRRGKPVVMLKVGQSELGQRIALSHTAHMAGSDAIFDAVVRQYGVIRVSDYDELYLLAGLLASLTDEQRRRIGERPGIGVISISGGIGAILGDLAGSAGLRFADLSADTRERLQPLLPDFQLADNPFDVGAVALTDPSVVGKAARILSQDPGVGVVVPAITVAEDYDSILEEIAGLEGATPAVALWSGRSFRGRGAGILKEGKVPYFDTPAQLVTALSRLTRYCAQRRQWLESPGKAPAPEAAASGPAARPGQPALDEWQSKQWLRALGFPVVKGDIAQSESQALRIAESLGYPVVLKLLSADLPHKSEHGAVILGLRGAAEVADAYRRLQGVAESLAGSARVDGVLVEAMFRAPLEVVVGLNVDPQFGPVVMVGSGGVLVELLRDTAFLVPPFGEREIRAAIAGTRTLGPLLRGFRGRPAADADALVAFLLQCSARAEAMAEHAAEVEINPLLVGEKGRGAWVADALVRLRTDGDTPKQERLDKSKETMA